jgi:hypothetical protein
VTQEVLCQEIQFRDMPCLLQQLLLLSYHSCCPHLVTLSPGPWCYCCRLGWHHC